MKNSRRRFLKNIAGSSAAIVLGGVGAGFSPKSYRKIMGANDSIRVCMGF